MKPTQTFFAAGLAAFALAGLLTTSSALAGTCSGCSSNKKMMTTTAAGDIVEVASDAKAFNTLLAAAKAAGLVEALQGDGPLTVFAPTDEAFAKLPEGTVETLLKPENKGKLASILTYHVVAGKVTAEKVVETPALATLNGQRIDIKVSDDGVMVDNAKVLKTDVMASNGVIHVIDSVILPNDQNVVGVAAGNETFSTLVAAVKAAELVKALSGEGPFTVFAPTNEAFAKLPKGTVESLLKPENKDQLIAVLTYHVVPGRVFSPTAAKGATVKTLNGATVTTKSDDEGRVFVNKAQVVAADVDASNGVIHVIDRVILPPSPEQAAAQMIETTIAQGVKAFNAGHHAACARMYSKTLMALSTHDAIHPQMQQAIKFRIRSANHNHDMTNRAWMHRNTLDMVYTALDTDAMTEMAANR